MSIWNKDKVDFPEGDEKNLLSQDSLCGYSTNTNDYMTYVCYIKWVLVCREPQTRLENVVRGSVLSDL